MKKLLLLSTVLLGAVQASPAGVHLGFGISLPIPLPPPFIIGRPAPVFIAAVPVCQPAAPVFFAQPACEVYPPPVVVVPRPVYYPYRHGYYVHRGWGQSHGHGHRR